MLPAISANKNSIVIKPICHFRGAQWWARGNLRREINGLPATKPSATAYTPDGGPWEDSRWKSTWYWPWIAKVHIKGINSASPDSCIYPYIKKGLTSLRCLAFFDSNLLIFWLFFYYSKNFYISWFRPSLFEQSPSELSQRLPPLA